MRNFWQTKTLSELTEVEWESLCDGCGKCCLVKLQDEETDDIVYTNLSCRFLNLDTCRCQCYGNRLQRHPDCIKLQPKDVDSFHWLPETCAYRLIAEGKELPFWHHLITGDKDTVHIYDQSVSGRSINEADVHEEDWQSHIIRWVN